MAIRASSLPRSGASRRIVCAGLGRKSTFLVALSFYCLLSVAGIAADVQVNAPDHNLPHQGNFTSESETSVAVAGPLVVVGYNSTKQVARPPTARQVPPPTGIALADTPFRQMAERTSRTEAWFRQTAIVWRVIPPSPSARMARRCIMLRSARAGIVSRIFVSPSTSLSPAVTFGAPVPISGLRRTRSSTPLYRPLKTRR